MKFRKKGVVIDALQFTPENEDALLEFLEGCEGWHMTDKGLVIPTLEGDHLASPGDWIIKGLKGEFYPCKPDIFAMSYLPVTESNPWEHAEGERSAMHHSDGWYFKRLSDGAVRIQKRSGEEHRAVELEHVVPPNEWISLLGHLSSPNIDEAAQVARATKLHQA